MATTMKHLTYGDVASLPREREGDRLELIDGELVVTTVCTPPHQIVVSNALFAIDRFVRANGLGLTLPGPVSVRFTLDTMLSPDLCFVAEGRRHVVGPMAVDAAPDLVVEVVSPETRQRDTTVKRTIYARFGVQEYWIVDLETEAVTILAPFGDHFEPIAAGEDGAINSRILPRLRLTSTMVFAGV